MNDTTKGELVIVLLISLLAIGCGTACGINNVVENICGNIIPSSLTETEDIIDEIEKTKTLSKYFKSYEVDRWIDENNNLISQEEADINKYKSIKVKEWERDSYIKGMFILIKTLQNKIDILEKQIKKESD